MSGNRRVGRAARLLVLLLALPVTALALKDVRVVALFKDRAMVEIDGKRRLLRSGQTSPEGVTLVSADSAGAVLRYEGKTVQRRLDGRVRAPASHATPAGDEVRIYRDNGGMFRTVGSINGLPVNFLVDTGATTLAMNSAEARRLGIDFRVSGQSTYVTTASGVNEAFSVTLGRVKVGDIELHNVLLGMSFLRRVDLRNQGDHLTLRKKY
jgi:aspartyl protease family protein